MITLYLIVSNFWRFFLLEWQPNASAIMSFRLCSTMNQHTCILRSQLRFNYFGFVRKQHS